MDRCNRCQATLTPPRCALYLRNSDWFRLYLLYYAAEETGKLQLYLGSTVAWNSSVNTQEWIANCVSVFRNTDV